MISQNDVKHIASLARINLKDQETELLTKDLEKILSYVKKLETLDVTNVQAMSHVFPIENVYRGDVLKPSLSQAQSLKIAVEQKDGAFKVPKVIE